MSNSLSSPASGASSPSAIVPSLLPLPVSLSSTQAHLVAFGLTASYVGGMYLSRLSVAKRRTRTLRAKTEQQQQQKQQQRPKVSNKAVEETRKQGSEGLSGSSGSDGGEQEQEHGGKLEERVAIAGLDPLIAAGRATDGSSDSPAITAAAARNTPSNKEDADADADTDKDDDVSDFDSSATEEEVAYGLPALGDRDHPHTIRSRVRAVMFSTVVGGGVVGELVRRGLPERRDGTVVLGGWKDAIRPTLRLMGLTRLTFPDVLLTLRRTLTTPTATTTSSFNAASRILAHATLPYLLAPILFLGPLYCLSVDRELPWQSSGKPVGASLRFLRVLVPEKIRGWLTDDRRRKSEAKMSLPERAEEVQDWMDFRNYVAGPVSEEFVFRSLIIGTYVLSGASTRALTFASPLWFGIAHVHHAWDVFVRGSKTSGAAIRALAGCTFQFAYTTLFGWFAAYLLVRTGSIYPSIAAHIFCNVMSVPNPGPTLQEHPEKQGRIWAAYAIGIVGFAYGLTRL